MEEQSGKKIGIMGGTLDPIHIGHLIIAEEAYMKYNLDYVLFMPSGNPPHKSHENISSKSHRSNMVKLSIKDNPHFKFSDFELSRDGYIYTSDTLKLLKEQYVDTEFFFILGADSLFSIEKWHNPKEVMNDATILVANREQNTVKDCLLQTNERSLKEQVEYLNHKYHAKIELLNSPIIDISSTYIRKKVCSNVSIKYYVTDNVEKYIKNNNLYSSNNMN